MGKTQIDAPRSIDVSAATARALPAYLKALSDNVLPYQQALLEAQKVVEPQQVQYALENYKRYGPEFNALGNQIAAENATANAQRELDVLNGTGSALIQRGIALDKELNPEFYRTRELVNNSYGNLVGSIDPNKLTGSETAEIERNLGRTGELAGSRGWTSALAFGEALNRKKDRLASVLAQGPGLINASRSAVDPFLIGTGRQSQINTGEARLQNPNNNFGSNVASIGGGLLNNTFNLENSNADRNLKMASENNAWNRAQQGSQIFSNVMSGFTMG